MYDIGTFKTRGMFTTLSNIFDGKFYSQSCVTLVYLESWHIQNPTIFRVLPSIYQEIFYSKPCVVLIYSQALVYPELLYFLKSKHIQNPAEYLIWSSLLRTLCNYSRYRPYIFKTFAYSEPVCVSYSLMYQLFFRTNDALLYPLIKIWATL